MNDEPTTAVGDAKPVEQPRENGFYKLNRVLAACAGFLVVVMMFLIASDVTGRYVFRKPIPGAYEISEFLLVAVVFLSITHTEVVNKHVRVVFLTSRFSAKHQFLFLSFARIVGVFVFGLIAWTNFSYGFSSWRHGETSFGFLDIPTYPWIFIIAVGSCLLCLALLLGIASDFRLNRRRM